MSPMNANYFLGRLYDPKTKGPTDEPVLLDPSNLTTHCVVTGMTGSGKTGLCIGLLEEAALHKTPAIIIDPKGDLTNLVLHFPNQSPADFEPWIDPEAARREGKTVPQLAEETAARWKQGLADWGIGAEQLQELADAAEYTIYSPGSTSGVPVNILSSFEAPSIPFSENAEVLRERISTTVTAILGLIGISDIDPLRSREHILLSSLIENAWMQNLSLNLTDLILQVQNPPMDRLGAFPMDSFSPERDRFDLALLLNNFLASPSFQVWQQGQPLDVQAMLYTKDGGPRHSVFYLAHLSENERMFFVTLLFAAVESWMRGQRGTGNLRALLYFDEIMGYLPPVANPASKTVMLRMLKQARAFGVGLLLATQNPVDVDYKALSNAGTWMIGRLQTDQDKQRLLDGLSSAGGQTDIRALDQMISGLGKRVFLLHSVYKSAPVLFNTRWAMNYLAGPMTRDQLAAANALVGAGSVTISASSSGTGLKPSGKTEAVRDGSGYSTSRPAVPGDIPEYFFPNNLSFNEALIRINLPSDSVKIGLAYKVGLFLHAENHYVQMKNNIDQREKISIILQEHNSVVFENEDFLRTSLGVDFFEGEPLPNTHFFPITSWLADQNKVKAVINNFKDWVSRNATISIKSNQKLKIVGTPTTTDEEFNLQIQDSIKKMIALESEKITNKYQEKITSLKTKIDRQELDVKNAKTNSGFRNVQTLAKGGMTIFSTLAKSYNSKGKIDPSKLVKNVQKNKGGISSTISDTRMSTSAKDKIEIEEQTLNQLNNQLKILQEKEVEEIAAVKEVWSNVINETLEIPIRSLKKDTYYFECAIWLPFYLVEVQGKNAEVPAFKP